jgi:hypothetical protein
MVQFINAGVELSYKPMPLPPLPDILQSLIDDRAKSPNAIPCAELFETVQLLREELELSKIYMPPRLLHFTKHSLNAGCEAFSIFIPPMELFIIVQLVKTGIESSVLRTPLQLLFDDKQSLKMGWVESHMSIP